MANVQLENGYTRIANELLQALAMFSFSGAELAICLMLIRLTYGYHQIKRQISLGMLARETGLHRISVAKTVDHLVKTNVVGKQNTKGKRTINILWINKDYATWTVSLRANRSVSQSANSAISQMANLIKKEKEIKKIDDFKKDFLRKHAIN